MRMCIQDMVYEQLYFIFFLINIIDFDAKLSIGPFSAACHKTTISTKATTRANWKKGIYLAQWMRTQSKTDQTAYLSAEICGQPSLDCS